jgi:hypothetical protein
MPIHHVGEIAYEPAAPPGGIRLQANPPVCNRGWYEITPQNLGQASSWGLRTPQAALHASSGPRAPRCAPVSQSRRS